MARPNTRSSTKASSPPQKRKAEDDDVANGLDTKKKKTKVTPRPASAKESKQEPPPPKPASRKAKKKASPPPSTSSTSSAPPSSEPHYYLMKAEPNSRLENGIDVKFSIDDLRACTVPEPWEGVRNYVARNNMMTMKKGELAFFYHSNCKVPGIAGIMEIVEEGSIDESAFNPKHPYYDPKSSRDKPRWYHVHVAFKQKFDELVTLKELQSLGAQGGVLQNMQLLKQSRLSVSKVSKEEWECIMDMVEKRGKEGKKEEE